MIIFWTIRYDFGRHGNVRFSAVSGGAPWSLYLVCAGTSGRTVQNDAVRRETQATVVAAPRLTAILAAGERIVHPNDEVPFPCRRFRLVGMCGLHTLILGNTSCAFIMPRLVLSRCRTIVVMRFASRE